MNDVSEESESLFPQESAPETAIYTVDVTQAAHALGVSQARLSQITGKGILSFVKRKVGTRWRLYYRQDELDEIINQQSEFLYPRVGIKERSGAFAQGVVAREIELPNLPDKGSPENSEPAHTEPLRSDEDVISQGLLSTLSMGFGAYSSLSAFRAVSAINSSNAARTNETALSSATLISERKELEESFSRLLKRSESATEMLDSFRDSLHQHSNSLEARLDLVGQRQTKLADTLSKILFQISTLKNESEHLKGSVGNVALGLQQILNPKASRSRTHHKRVSVKGKRALSRSLSS